MNPGTTAPAPVSAPVRVAVIGGGRNCEHEVGLATAASVCAALPADRYTAVPLTVDRDGTWLDPDGRPFADGPVGALRLLTSCEVVFPAVHGPHGEDGALAGWCELAGLPHVGSGVRAGALAMDKHATKLIARDLGIATARGVLVTEPPAPGAPCPLPLPVVVKPIAAGSSHGVRRVDRAEEYAPAVAAALALDGRVLVEEFVTGREIDVAVLRRADGTLRTGPALEIVTAPGALFDTEDKYGGGADFRLPAELPGPQEAALGAAARALFEALGCAGVARVDFFLTPEGRPVLNEVNTMPGMTANSQVPKMFAVAGLPYPELLAELVEAGRRAGR
ncbi:D-alanine--D-alanine ligase family protein (plasmid) [Streptomyces sp. BI20]|uniref:D-alanine--D-alanine ligase family protein n=1 Tax=Streptomyces sp. BI20 TaxID=3403460 RepID=UPI003C7208AE